MMRFTTNSTIDGYEVIDQDGRPVTNSYTFANKPLEIASNLNRAVEADHEEGGCKHLRLALGCVEEDDEFDALLEEV